MIMTRIHVVHVHVKYYMMTTLTFALTYTSFKANALVVKAENRTEACTNRIIDLRTEVPVFNYSYPL